MPAPTDLANQTASDRDGRGIRVAAAKRLGIAIEVDRKQSPVIDRSPVGGSSEPARLLDLAFMGRCRAVEFERNEDLVFARGPSASRACRVEADHADLVAGEAGRLRRATDTQPDVARR